MSYFYLRYFRYPCCEGMRLLIFANYLEVTILSRKGNQNAQQLQGTGINTSKSDYLISDALCRPR